MFNIGVKEGMAKTDDIHTVTVTVEDWAKVADNPIQRNTEAHATRSSKPGGHLSLPHETHRNVAAALLPSGKMIKLDGHSRSWLWSESLLNPMPGELIVTVYPVKNKAEAVEYYRNFDSSASVETKRDKLFGAFRINNFFPQHGYLFNNCGVMSAIEFCSSFGAPNRQAVKRIPFDILVKPWLDALRILDMGDFHNHYAFRSPVMCAALLAIRRDGNRALSFFQSYHDGGGTKNAKNCDGIYAAESLYRTMREECENRSGHRVLNVYVPYFIFAYDQWWNDNKMKPWGNVLHKRMPSDMFSAQEWFQLTFGKYDFVDELAPKQQVLEID